MLRIVKRTATILLLVSASLLFSSCDQKKASTFAAEILAPVLPVIAQAVLDDPAAQRAMGKDGEALARAAWIVAKPALENAISGLAFGDGDERVAYKRIMKESPDFAAVFYRLDDDGIPAGLWPRLDAWLKLKGYTGGASQLWQQINVHRIKVTITKEDSEELEKLMGPAIVEEYIRVRDNKLHYTLPDYGGE